MHIQTVEGDISILVSVFRYFPYMKTGEKKEIKKEK